MGRLRCAAAGSAMLLVVGLFASRELPASMPPQRADNPSPQVIDADHPERSFHFVLRGEEARKFKFVRVWIGDIVNPQTVGVSFEVAYRPDTGTRIPLGSFSLYPSTDPGRFIVATQGRVTRSGTITLSLRTSGPLDPTQPFSLTIDGVELSG